MSWKNLKIFAIVTLLVMDIIFAFCVIERKLSVLYYEDPLIDSALTVFSESGLQIDRSFLKKRKQLPAVYLGSADTDALLLTMQKNGFTAEEDDGGIRLTGDRGEFFFGDDLSFSYFSDENQKAPSALLREGFWTAVSDEEETSLARERVLTFLDEFELIADGFSKYRYEIVCDRVYHLGNRTIVSCIQYLDGMPLHNGFALSVLDGQVVSADGTFAILLPNEKKTAENIGLMNVFFAEKAYIDSLTEKQTFTLSSISYSYGLYFDADGTFYLIPLCEIVYTNGEKRTYNFVSGKLYS